MDTHELAKSLMDSPKREIVASVDVSADDSNGYQRCFADESCVIRFEADGTVTMLFTGGYDNGDA